MREPDECSRVSHREVFVEGTASDFGMATLRGETELEVFTYAGSRSTRPALRVRVERPAGTEVTGHDPLTWSDGQVVTEVSFACESGPVAITVTQCNMSASSAMSEPPALEFTSQDPLVWWLGGVTNYIAHSDPRGRLQAFWPYGTDWKAEVSRSQPARARIWPMFRKLAPMTSVG